MRNHNDLCQWLKFFLVGVEQTANNAITTLQKIISLRELTEHKLLALGKKITVSQTLLCGLYSSPIVDSKAVCAITFLTPAAANRLISDFIRLEILTEKTGYKRNRVYVFTDYLKLFI